MPQSETVETGRKATRPAIERLLKPRSIALVGVSSTPGSLGEAVLINLERAQFGGEIHLVNPKRPVIRGRQCVGSIDELPAGVDCAVLAIPGTAILPSIRACASRGVGSAIVFSAGFAEAGEDGRAAQLELRRIAQEHGMLVEGPNCLGMVNYVEGIPLTFVATPPQPRTEAAAAAILSQSGALAAVVAVNMRRFEIPLTYTISTGNEAVSGVEDYLDYLLHDENTRVVALIVEQFRSSRRFLDAARVARLAGKFLVLLHPGRTGAARASAVTHTGAIAGDYETMRTLVRHAGVVPVDSMEELVDVTQILVRSGNSPSGGAAIFTESGAFKALAIDLCDRVGLELPAPGEETVRELRRAMPNFIPATNPLDLTAQALVDPDLYRRTLAPVLKDQGFGSVLLAIILTDADTTRLKLPPIVAALTALKPKKPVVFAALDEGAPFDFPELGVLRKLGVACFPSPERAIRALSQASRCACDVLPSNDACGPVLPRLAAGIYTEVESKGFLAQLGIPIPRGALARTLDEAQAIAVACGFPVALKAQSRRLAHKSDAGGVLLGIQTKAELEAAWRKVHTQTARARPGMELDGILVERMGGPGLEMIVGGRNNSQWGPILMAGFGGVLAEAAEDASLLPPDLSPAQIAGELERLRCSRLFHGFRGSPPLDIDALADTIVRIGSFMRLHPEVMEIDINPLVIHEQGSGVTALDCLIVAGEQELTANDDNEVTR